MEDRAGGGRWTHWFADLKRLCGEQHGPDVRVTTLFDLYGLPEDFPGFAAHPPGQDTLVRVEGLEEAMRRT